MRAVAVASLDVWFAAARGEKYRRSRLNRFNSDARRIETGEINRRPLRRRDVAHMIGCDLRRQLVSYLAPTKIARVETLEDAVRSVRPVLGQDFLKAF